MRATIGRKLLCVAGSASGIAGFAFFVPVSLIGGAGLLLLLLFFFHPAEKKLSEIMD